MKMPRSSPWMAGSTRTTPSISPEGTMVATYVLLVWGAAWLAEWCGRAGAGRPGHLDVAADQAVGEPGDVDDAAAGQHDRMLELAVDDLAIGGDRAERAHVAVRHLGALADDGRAEDAAVRHHGARLDHDPALDRRGGVDAPLDTGLERLEDEPVALQERVLLAGVDPPALEDLVVDAAAVVDQPLDGVGDLELTAPRRGDRRDRLVDLLVEQVDADERQVGRRVGRLLDEAGDLAVDTQLGHAELTRVVHFCEQDLGGRLGRRLLPQAGGGGGGPGGLEPA